MGGNHHDSNSMTPEFIREMREAYLDHANLVGKQNDFPAGKYTERDEGAIGFVVGSDTSAGKVVIDFRDPVKWLGMDPEQAENMATLLRMHATRCRNARRRAESA